VTEEEANSAKIWDPFFDASAGLASERVVRLTFSTGENEIRSIMPDSHGWNEKGISWWRSQTTRY